MPRLTTSRLQWIAIAVAFLLVISGALLDRHPIIAGLAFMVFGIVWIVATYAAGHDAAYLEGLSRARLKLRRFEFGSRRRLTDEEWIRQDALWQGRMARIFPLFGVLMIGAGVLIMVRGD